MERLQAPKRHSTVGTGKGSGNELQGSGNQILPVSFCLQRFYFPIDFLKSGRIFSAFTCMREEGEDKGLGGSAEGQKLLPLSS